MRSLRDLYFKDAIMANNGLDMTVVSSKCNTHPSPSSSPLKTTLKHQLCPLQTLLTHSNRSDYLNPG